MTFQETILLKGRPRLVDAASIHGKTFLISKGLLRIASPKNGWHEDVHNPEEVVQALKRISHRVDMLKFWQKLPDVDPKFTYYRESVDIAAIPITDYRHWWEKQIVSNARNKIRKAQKQGVVFKEVALDDHLIRGIVDIFNQSPVRRGKPFWHYGKTFETVKDEMSLRVKDSVFVGAYFGDELIGFIKVLLEGQYARSTMILDKVSQRDKAPVNGMLAKVVEICAERKLPFFLYSTWRRGDHGHFQQSNGFEKVSIPEYFVPLTLKGKLALRVGLHKGIKEAVPESVMVRLLALRMKWYSKHGRQSE
ncbi:MAG TPA: hypothetical protein VI485_28315 [Vicinamibacterales bacterium]|nr:hypothetical protein [Vicinamibacterales bacterium]